jgi:hypothetical protein
MHYCVFICLWISWMVETRLSSWKLLKFRLDQTGKPQISLEGFKFFIKSACPEFSPMSWEMLFPLLSTMALSLYFTVPKRLVPRAVWPLEMTEEKERSRLWSLQCAPKKPPRFVFFSSFLLFLHPLSGLPHCLPAHYLTTYPYKRADKALARLRFWELTTCGLCSRDLIFNIFTIGLIKQGTGDKFSLWTPHSGEEALERTEKISQIFSSSRVL